MGLFVDIHKKMGRFSLDIAFETDGSTMGLLGASGSGKSMTLKCIAGIEKPDEGKIIMDGVTLFDSERHIDLSPQERKVGYLFQNYALFPNMNTRRNIMCGLHRDREYSKSGKAHRVSEIIEMMQLQGLDKRKPHQLSGGQQQRTALARILVGNPQLLMLDEPFSSLDSHLRAQLQLQLKEVINQFGNDVLLVTHSRDEAYRLCERIALIDGGRIIINKDTKGLFADPESRQAALITGCKNIIDARKTGEYEVDVSQWGVRLKTAEKVRDDLCAVGIRAHYFASSISENCFPIQIAGEIEEPFENVWLFRYENQDMSSPDIWWQMPKQHEGEFCSNKLGVSPENVLLLYK